MPSSKKPGVRLAKYEKLISRFFEALILASLVKKCHGSHVTIRHDLSTIVGIKRRFLTNLAFLCDCTKGGPSTTAISVENRQDCFVMWLASNEGVSPKMTSFVESVLNDLRAVPSMGERQSLEASLLQRTAVFAHARVFKEWKMLVRLAGKALTVLAEVAHQDTALQEWLKQFQLRRDQTPISICRLAYEIRQDEQIHNIEVLHNSLNDTSGPDVVKHLKWVAHFVGRLAARVRAVKHLMDDAARLEHDLENPWMVKAVPLPQATSVPESDKHTNLRGILNRMMDASDPERERLFTCIDKMDQAYSLMEAILSRHADGSNPLKPVIHCEIQLIDHFHDHQLSFWEENPYVACSKPTCLLCRLYMKHHPIPFEETDSHNNIPTNWSPAFLPCGINDSRFICQRNTLNAVIRAIRGPILVQIGRASCSSTFHADSLDQITQPDYDPFDHLDSDSTSLTEVEDYAWPTGLGNLGLYERFELLKYSS
ncbi:conserved hypothetical protein [Verticillium alfalfae VaMs.102]|uniref:Uncharacterized protein n=1 Tax=Verticillium alfalfae (strain VaMs.102 / ATCC MYA-4576 / FGSC 10136) TaxID=526221 RepID=C9SYV9_VERA1|nr:conserved hypothetical protein [Verticillium alfalfae VaMs.102]EEY23974.1 conserved hypothetical protein [Verticillium alfalfae VaMs.102]